MVRLSSTDIIKFAQDGIDLTMLPPELHNYALTVLGDYVKNISRVEPYNMIYREQARKILAEIEELSPQDRFNKLRSPADCYAITCIYDQSGCAGIMKWIELGKKHRK